MEVSNVRHVFVDLVKIISLRSSSEKDGSISTFNSSFLNGAFVVFNGSNDGNVN